MRMRAAIMFEQGRSRPYAESRPLVVEEVELEPPGPGDVLIEIAAAGLCHSDLSGIGGIRPRPVPVVLGQKGAGVVREGVADLRPGDHVVTVFVTSLEKINAAFDRLAEGGVLRQILRPNG